ncbi:hypothetical protein QUF55_05370 [Clostridiaceae bacterium HSG29]|nr:hypothetical protein [Clostridiaceae bacterium HSG29]
MSVLLINTVKLEKFVVWKYKRIQSKSNQDFDLTLVAESVEDDIMLSKLRQSGMDIVQGIIKVIEKIETNNRVIKLKIWGVGYEERKKRIN